MKRFAIGLLIFLGCFLAYLVCFVVVKHSLGALYSALSKPFLGSITAGVIYSLIEGLIGLLLYRIILILLADRHLADKATVIVGALSVVLLPAASVLSMIMGRFPENPLVILPTLAIWAPWMIAAFLVRGSVLTRRDGHN